MLSSFNRWKDTTVEEEHFERLQDAGVETLDVALDAQRRRSQAQVAFYTAMCEYNKVIALVHRRKGTILAYSGVHFEEGPWTGKAYLDAQEHARRRGASQQINYGWSRPGVISRGENWPTAQNTGHVPTGHSIPAPNHQVLTSEGVTPIYDTLNPTLEGSSGVPINATPIQDGLYYGNPDISPFDGPAPVLESPIPAGSSSRNAIPAAKGKVRQVSYVEPAEPESAQTRSSRVKNSGKTTPVAVLKKQYRKPKKTSKTKTRPTTIKRDHSPKPVRKLSAVPKSKTTKSSTKQKSLPKKMTYKAPTATPSLAWEKLGMRRPETHSTGVTAKIKTN